MKPLSTLFLALIALSLSANAETAAKLEVEILPGILGVTLPTKEIYRDVLGPVQSTPTEQKDAIRFDLKDIAIDDLNGDGAGWKLLANPTPLNNGADSLPTGADTQFIIPDKNRGTLLESPNALVYTSGEGVQNFKVEYKLSYDVPANISSGTYSGVVVFSVVAL